MRRTLIAAAAGAAGLAGRVARARYGIAAVGCACTGVWQLAGWPWALITAVPFLLVLDHRA